MKKRDVRIVGLIPARGGSKGILKKNIRFVNGKPLIAHSIESTLNSEYIDKVVVSTDNKEIAEISREYGAEVIPRPKELARDESPTIDAIMHALNWLEERDACFDVIALIEPTSPLRKENDIDDAIELFIRNFNKSDSLVSLGEVHLENPYITKKIEGGYVTPLIEIDKTIHQRQQLPRVYFPYGVIYISKINSLKKYRTFYQERTIPYFIERWQNYEIDDFYDFLCVERIGKYKTKKSITYPDKPIEGQKIRLREFTDENLYDKRYHKWLQDIDIVETIGRPEYLTPIPFNEVEEYVNELKSSDNNYFFAISFKDNDDFIGTLKIGSIDWESKIADIGILIGDTNYWGKGIAKDSVYAACDYAFMRLGMRKITGGSFSTNIAMCKCFESLGFKKEAVLRKKCLFRGNFVDHALYGIFKDEFYHNN